MKTLFRSFAMFVAVAALPSGLFAQERGTVTGTVVDQGTNQPLAGAQITVSGTQLGTITNQQGRFVIPNVPTGPRQVRASVIGYSASTQTVNVAAGQTQNLSFALVQSAVELDEIVVTATGEQRTRELANAVSNINADQVTETQTVTTLSDLITGRAAGVRVIQNSGTTGTNQRIRIRGSTSLSLSNDPIVIVDGVRVYSNSNGGVSLTGGQITSALNSINPQEIENIEIIKGPSAATLYGTDAANGVILITTRSGQAGAPRWRVFAEAGQLDDENDYPFNYAGRTATGGACFAFQVGLGSCEQAVLHAHSPLTDPVQSPIGTGDRQQFGASVSGGSENVQYFLSADREKENGIWELPSFYRDRLESTGLELTDNQLRPNSMEKVALRANINADLGANLLAGVNVGYVQQETFLPHNDNNAWGVLGSALLGNAFNTEERNFGWGFMDPAGVFSIETEQDLDRVILGTNLTWTPIEWFTGRATVGLDNTARNDQRFMPVGLVPFSASTRSGERFTRRTQVLANTADIGGTVQLNVHPDVTSRSSAGVQFYREWIQFTQAFGQQLPPGSKSAGSAAQQFVGEGTGESITLGTFVEQQFGWRDRVFLTGALRSDDHSAFGQDFNVIVYPKVGLSVVALEQSDRQFVPGLNTVRLRAAWGAAGRAPGSTDAILFFVTEVASVAGVNAPGVTFSNDAASGSLGNPNLEPERSEELELGADVGFLEGRLGLEFTYYDRNTKNLLVDRPLPGSLGTVTSRFENLGRVSNSGFELVIDAQPVNVRNFSWDVNVTGSRNTNKLDELGLDVDSILFGPQRFQEGFPLGGFFAETITFDDANGNDIIEPGEITRDPDARFIGPAFPEREVGIQSSITLFNLVRVAGMLDHKGDFYQYNFTEEFRCRFAICRGLVDPNAPLDQQARAVQSVTLGANRSSEPYIEDASFWKLRELSIGVNIPDRWTGRFGATNGSLVLSGRNLKTWTDYSGLDPELNQTATANFTTREFLTQPPVRTWTVRLNLGF